MAARAGARASAERPRARGEDVHRHRAPQPTLRACADSNFKSPASSPSDIPRKRLDHVDHTRLAWP
jgi:hypothetical protein